MLCALGAWLAGVLPGYAVALAAAGAILPNPTRMDYRFLPPEAPPPRGVDGVALAERAEALRSRMEDALVELRAKRRTPWG